MDGWVRFVVTTVAITDEFRQRGRSLGKGVGFVLDASTNDAHGNSCGSAARNYFAFRVHRRTESQPLA